MSIRLCLLYLLAAFASAHYHGAPAANPGKCVTDATCPCSTKEPVQCLVHQSDNKCLLRPCDKKYTCNCAGYELCTISSCPQWTSHETAMATRTNPVSCTESGTRQCVSVGGVIASAQAAEKAVMDGYMYIEGGTTSLSNIFVVASGVIGTLQDMNRKAEETELLQVVSEDKLDEIYKTKDFVHLSVERIVDLLKKAAQPVHDGDWKMREAVKMWKEAKSAALSREEKERALQEAKMNGSYDSGLVAQLEEEIEGLQEVEKSVAGVCVENILALRSYVADVKRVANEAKGVGEEVQMYEQKFMKRVQAILDGA